jgi:hypothetical protein
VLDQKIQGNALLWSALVALVRINDRSGTTIQRLKQAERHFRAAWEKAKQNSWSNDDVLFPILHETALLALAAKGDEKSSGEVLQRMEKGGLASFDGRVGFVLADALATMGERAWPALRNVILSQEAPVEVRTHALIRLHESTSVEPDFLKRMCGAGPATLRALAIRLLAVTDGPLARQICQEVVAAYAKGQGSVDADRALVIATATEVAGCLGVAWGEEIVQALARADKAEAVASRDVQNPQDLSKCTIQVYPPLLEHLAIEAGRSGLPGGRAVLMSIVQSQRPSGRWEAALALGAVGGREGVVALIEALSDPDGWLRFCAYRALHHLSGQDYFCDWVFGSMDEMRKNVGRYRKWFDDNPPK